MQKSLMNFDAPLIPYSQPPKSANPSECAFDNPPVLAQLLTTLYSSTCNPRCYAPLPQSQPTTCVIVALVCMHLDRTLAPTTACMLLDGLDSVKHICKSITIMHISSGANDGKRYPVLVYRQVTLGTSFALIGRIGPSCFAPFLAATVAESTQARDQPIAPSSPSLSSKAWCIARHTPACCQSRNLRQHVMPLPQPISLGSNSQGAPVRNMKRIPVSTALLGIRGRPPLGLSGSLGKRGSSTAHSSSERIGLAMPNCTISYSVLLGALSLRFNHGSISWQANWSVSG